MTKHWKAYLLVCIALLLSGCSGGPTGSTHAKASPTATMSPPTPTPLTVNLTPLSMQQAWGNIQISRFSLDLGDRYFSPTGSEFNGITDDGQVCGETSAVVFENLETGQQVRLPMSYAPTTVAFAGTSYVYTNSDYSQVTLAPSILTQPMTSYVIEDKTVDGSGFDEFPTMNDRLIIPIVVRLLA